MTENLPTYKPQGLGLSARLLLLTLGFVMLAEVLIFVPSIANFRNTWLNDRLASARTAALVLEAAPDDALPETLVKELLMNVGAETIALRIKGTRRLLAVNDMPPPVSAMFDLRDSTAFRTITESFDTLFNGGNRSVGVIGDAPMGGDFVEIVIAESPLRDAMFRFAQNIMALSLFISGLTGALVFLSLKRLIVRPVEKLTKSITRFAESPEDHTRLIKPSGRTDEIGTAETAVAGMQQVVFQQLKQKEHLAALGLAVSKINHDLRNMLSSAQLISDRLGAVEDPTVQRFAPKLVQTLDRAIAFCQSTLAYGRAEERPPESTQFDLNTALEEVADAIGLSEEHPVRWQNNIPAKLMIVSDPEHLFRACTNLCRNALQAMENTPLKNGNHHVLSVSSAIVAYGWQLDITDTGPGIPPAVRQKLFEAFHGSSRPGGTGLGLAIAADLIRAQGGTISLLDQTEGTCFRIMLPREPSKLENKAR
jgi:signal transduction histidine kinase